MSAEQLPVMTDPVAEMIDDAKWATEDHWNSEGGYKETYADPAKAQVFATLAVAEAIRELNATLEALLPAAGRGI